MQESSVVTLENLRRLMREREAAEMAVLFEPEPHEDPAMAELAKGQFDWRLEGPVLPLAHLGSTALSAMRRLDGRKLSGDVNTVTIASPEQVSEYISRLAEMHDDVLGASL